MPLREHAEEWDVLNQDHAVHNISLFHTEIWNCRVGAQCLQTQQTFCIFLEKGVICSDWETKQLERLDERQWFIKTWFKQLCFIFQHNGRRAQSWWKKRRSWSVRALFFTEIDVLPLRKVGRFVFELFWHTHDLLHCYTLDVITKVSQTVLRGQNQDHPSVLGCVALAGTAALSHQNVFFITVLPSLPPCHTAPSSKTHQMKQPALISDTLESQRSCHVPGRRWPESYPTLNI